MSYLPPSTSSLQSTGRIDQGSIRGESQRQSHGPRAVTVSIHILDDDSLLNVFYLYRPAIFDEDKVSTILVRGGRAWDCQRWWHKLAQVCQRWRYLILGSASYLRLCLVCTYGTPVADMLAHSPHFPLIIDYFDVYWVISAEDEKGITVALEQRDRVCHVRLRMPSPNLQKLIYAMDEEFPVLEYLNMQTLMDNTALMLPETFQAPRLRFLLLNGFALPLGSRLLTTAVGLVTFALISPHPSTYFQPGVLLRWLLFMPQLEKLLIRFFYPALDSDVEGQLVHTPIMTHVTLPDLRFFEFQGSGPYMEAVFRRITTPHLEKLCIHFLNQPTFSVPSLLQFINTAENLRFDSANFQFSIGDVVSATMYLREDEVDVLSIVVYCYHFNRQVSSVAQIFSSPGQMLSTVEHLTLGHDESPGEHDGANSQPNRTEWRNLLGLFSNVTTLHVDEGLVEELSRCLRLDDGEHLSELLPKLQELTYSGSGDAGDAFTSFIDARQNAGRPVALTLCE